ncbi:MAG: transcription antitermination factor NusB [Pseudobdellovibrionaceae bacterium]|jgi:N utilization substance protein B
MRRESRELAMQILFHHEFETNQASTLFSVEHFLALFEKKFNAETLTYAQLLFEGIQKNRNAVDDLIHTCSAHWKMNRMSSVDRNILRVATFELKFSTGEVQPQVAMNEAIEIAKKYSTAESSAFINGVLDQVSKR